MQITHSPLPVKLAVWLWCPCTSVSMVGHCSALCSVDSSELYHPCLTHESFQQDYAMSLKHLQHRGYYSPDTHCSLNRKNVRYRLITSFLCIYLHSGTGLADTRKLVLYCNLLMNNRVEAWTNKALRLCVS